MKHYAGLIILCLSTIVSPAIADDSGGSTIEQAITSGKAHVDFRYRYEWVDTDAMAEDANASTLRLRLNYATGAWKGWSAFVEADHVAEVLINDFNSGSGTSPGRSQYPVVADPRGTDLNQLYVEYAGTDDWRVRIGRQRILLDNQRFVGGVGWRQNEQTYDGFSATFMGFDRAEVFYSYVANVNRIYGDRVDAGDQSQDTHLLNARVNLSDNWTVTGYAYLIDNDDSPASSADTLGIRVNGSIAAQGGKLSLLGEFASQSDAANAPVSFDADYYRLEVAYDLDNGFGAGLGLESMGGDATAAGRAFRTPLATLHAFDGWADQFLSTPDAGLEDLFIRAGYKTGPWTFAAVYHDFSAESGSQDFGTELDLSLNRKIGARYGLLFKFAGFDGDGNYADTSKFWLMFTGAY
jgi:hypothetical protein